jgi:16S rRNA C967 or C1407 C5-methylase (RsmB/RsmF family)
VGLGCSDIQLADTDRPGHPSLPAPKRGRLLGRVKNKTDPAKEKKSAAAVHKAEAEAPSFAAFANRYIEEYARSYKKPRTVEEDERNLRLHIKPALGRLKLKDVSAADVARFHAAHRSTPTNANRCRALMSHIFEIAERWGERPAGSNPCRHVEKFIEQKRERFLSAAEMARLGDALVGAQGHEPPAASPPFAY